MFGKSVILKFWHMPILFLSILFLVIVIVYFIRPKLKDSSLELQNRGETGVKSSGDLGIKTGVSSNKWNGGDIQE